MDRRSFLRRTGAAVVAAPIVALGLPLINEFDAADEKITSVTGEDGQVLEWDVEFHYPMQKVYRDLTEDNIKALLITRHEGV